MFMRSIVVFSLLVGAPLAAQPRLDDVFCDDSARLKQSLRQGARAEQQALGVRDPDTLLEIWVNPKSGDWTLVQSYANGTACILAIGEHWQAMPPGPV